MLTYFYSFIGKLSEKFLAELSVHIPTDWEKVGTYLHVSSHQMEHLRQQSMNKVDAWSLGMLRKWTEMSGGDVDITELCEALQEMGRNDLVQFVRCQLPDGASFIKKEGKAIKT